LEDYHDDTALLNSLHQFAHREINRHTGSNPLTELETWKLLLRIMRD
jgi:hypothetical protein